MESIIGGKRLRRDFQAHVPRCELLPVDDLLHPHELGVALGKDHNLPGPSSPWSSGGIGQLITAAPRLGQKVAHSDGHPQVGVLVHRSLPALDRYIVVRLVPEEEVVSHGHGEDGASPGEGPGAADQGYLVLGDEGAGAGLAVAPFFVGPEIYSER